MESVDDVGVRFRPDLEGLRAVAVALVVLYHANAPGFPGGYVGVDVFFVLSGFFITGLLYREIRKTDTVSLRTFYARRARRLLPAAGLVLLVTLAASIFILPGYRLHDVKLDVASAGLYVSNMRFGVVANDYFQATQAPSPVLHFWSLSVEEQFYIFWPALLIGLTWVFARVPRYRRALLVASVALLALVSFVACVWLTKDNQPWAFYLLPTRAWELAIGGLIALVAGRLVGTPRWIAAVAVAVGLFLIAGADLALDDYTAFPGTAAVLPVAGAALVIVGGMPIMASAPSRLLATRPGRFLGRISYSLYLWHWPILLFGTAVLGAAMSLPLVVVAVIVAAISQRLIEEPLRHGRFIGIRPSRNMLQAGALGLAILLVCVACSSSATTPAAATSVPGPTAALSVAATTLTTGVPAIASPVASQNGTSSGSQRPAGPAASFAPPAPCTGCSIDDLTPSLDDLRQGRIDGCLPEQLADTTACVLGYAPGTPVAVFGDSHDQNWLPGLVSLAEARGWRLINLTSGGCPSVSVTVFSYQLKRANDECDAWRTQALERIGVEQPGLVIMANSGGYDLIGGSGQVIKRSTYPGSQDWGTAWAAGLAKTIQELGTSSVVVIGDTPLMYLAGFDPDGCISGQPGDFQSCSAPRATVVDQDVRALERETAATAGATFIDPTDWLCDESACPAVIGTNIVYLDNEGHLTGPFGASVADRLHAALPPGW